jgi:hypothetical protein
MVRVITSAFALLLGLAAPQPLRAQGASAFDGTWTGTGRLTRNRSTGAACGAETTDRRLTIQGRRIILPRDTRTGIDVTGPIGADGRFEIVNGPNRFTGQASGSNMIATFMGRVCEREFRFRRRAG